MTERELAEYGALRATIRQRGTARVWVFVAGLGIWAIVTLAATLTSLPLVSVFSLLVLAGTFEAVFALHVGVERIGRYLQVVHEDKWEQMAMAFGPPPAGTGTDPLFSVLFGLAAVCNFVPMLAAQPVRIELAVLGGAHALFLLRIAVARQAAAKQRGADLERFRSLVRENNRQQ